MKALFFLFTAIFLLLVGVGTVVSPLLAAFLYRRRARRLPDENGAVASSEVSLTILIPAHHEKESLLATIFALKSCFKKWPKELPPPAIHVALSAWEGEEAESAARGASRVLHVTEPGKWRALLELVRSTESSWIAIVDAGTVWDEDLLTEFLPMMRDPQIVALNPAYDEENSGRLKGFFWFLEAMLKNLENDAGGPISFHGATMFFRRTALIEALNSLPAREWLNDDIILPLQLRLTQPDRRAVYVRSKKIHDRFPPDPTSEKRRRHRLVIGNLNWLEYFFQRRENVFTQPHLFMLVARRSARLFWAWWLIAFGVAMVALAFIMADQHDGLTFIGTSMSGFASGYLILRRAADRSPRLRGPVEAFSASLSLPITLWRHTARQPSARWK